MNHQTAENSQSLIMRLCAKRFAALINTYNRGVSIVRGIADDPSSSTDEKLRRLENIRQAFLHPQTDDDYPAAKKLGKMFVTENLDASLFLDVLREYEQNAGAPHIRIWEELLGYCRALAAPEGRLILALYNERVSAVLPMEQLCIVCYLVDYLGRIKKDVSLQKRCLIPADIMQKYDVRPGDFGLNYTTPGADKILLELCGRIEKILKDVNMLPGQITNFTLRLKICVILSLTNSMLQKYKRIDFLQNPPCLNMADWLWAFVFGGLSAVKRKLFGQGHVL